MSSNLPSRVRDLFHAALAHPRDDRRIFLRQACGADSDLFEEVWQLLDLYHQMEDDDGAQSSGGASASNADPFLGRRVGAYEIVRLIGAGGMGRVYFGRRADGAFEREVAIKVINPEVASADLLVRFEQEQRLLASLRHRGIAALLDAGRTDTGEPYFVMEHVDGVSIDEYCQRHDLPLHDRIALFIRVGEAVAEAHQRLIVHRDLKPKNILVDAGGSPKLVDFGIAKAITLSGLEASDPTRPLQKRVTPAYASPEQLRGQSAQTGMDVFSLGVVLHELVTGLRPSVLNADDTTAQGVAGFLRPSDALARSRDPARAGDGAPRAEESSGQTPAGVAPADLQGDLDAILLKAIHTDPRQRYRSVDAMVKDLQAYRQHLPVTAREWPASDRARNFVRRNPVLVTISTVAALALLAATASAARLWLIAARDRDRATVQIANQRELAEAAFAVESQLAGLAGATAPRRDLVDAISRYLSAVDYHGDPRVALATAEGYRRLGDVQGNPNVPNLGEPARAADSYRAALSILDAFGKSAANDAGRLTALIRTRLGLADVLAAQQATGDAEREYRAALQLAESLSAATADPTAHRVMLASVYRPLGDLELASGQADAAVGHFEQALAIDSDHVTRFPHDPEHRRLLALTQFRIGAARAAQGRLSEARDSYARAAGLLDELARAGHLRPSLRRDVAVGRVRLAVLLEADGDRSGRDEIRRALADLRALADADPADARLRRDIVSALVQLADAIRLDDAPTALRAYREARDAALALTAGPAASAAASRDLAIVDRRIASAAAGTLSTDLKLFRTVNGRRLLLGPGDAPPAANTPITVEATAARGWARYLLLFGATGPAQLLADDDLAQTGWTMPVEGPPPAQTILLLAFPRRLSTNEREQLVRDVDAIEGPRLVNPDAQIVWSPTDEPVDSHTTSRGAEPWVRAVRDRILKLGQVAVAGRTFPLAGESR